ncbi:IS1 family transposase [Pectobacterium sp. B1J-3]
MGYNARFFGSLIANVTVHCPRCQSAHLYL